MSLERLYGENMYPKRARVNPNRSAKICKDCKKDVKFGESGNLGLNFNIVLTCSCSRRIISSGPTIHTGFEINQRVVFIMRLLGVGRQGINIFCGLMDLCSGLSRHAYEKIVKHIFDAATKTFEKVTKTAV